VSDQLVWPTMPRSSERCARSSEARGYRPRACRHRQADINSMTTQFLVAMAPKGHAWPCIGLSTWRLCVGIEAAFVRQNPHESGEGSVSRSARSGSPRWRAGA
jgi:hypothetical protein